MRSRRFRVNEPKVLSETIDGVVIVLNFENGHYFSLNGPATFVWNQLARGCSLDAVAATLAARHGREPAAIEATLAEFVASLESEALLRPAEPDLPEPPAPEAPPEGDLAAPGFEKFTDMEQLLLLDPIHDVGAAGWPHERKG
jgi:hypothetical protein